MSERAVLVDWHEPLLRLYHVADVHVGAEACGEDECLKLASIIAGDRCARVIGGGDYTESIAPTDRRWDARELAKPVTVETLENPFYCQALRFVKLFEVTRGKWDGLILGNHGHTAIRRYFVNPASIIAEKLGARYVGGTDQCGWFRYRMIDPGGRTRSMVDVHALHGWGGGELREADALKMQRLLWRKGADVVLMAHTHRPMSFPETVERLDKAGNVVSEVRWGVVGYPLCGKHGYVARKGGNACPMGYTVVEVERNRKGRPRITVMQKTL